MSSKLNMILKGQLLSVFFVLSVLMAVSYPLAAKALTYREIIEAVPAGKVLSQATYAPVVLNSVENKSLKITATPLLFDSGNWIYQIDWLRTRNSQGSVYIALKSNANNTRMEVNTADQSGSFRAFLEPETSFRLEFFSEPNRKGLLLLRKFFMTMPVPVSNLDVSSPGISDTTFSGGTVTDEQSANNPAIQVSLINFTAKGEQVARFDTDGNAIDAHDGEIRYYAGKYYLYGTSYDCGFLWLRANTKFCGFKMYSSTDLMSWKYEGLVFDGSTALWQARCINGCFNLHSLYNPVTKQYVVWVNVQDSTTPYGYRVFTGNTPTGPFTETPTPPQLAYQHAGAGNIFLDEDGTAYYLYTLSGDINGGSLVIEKLNSAFTSGTGQKTFVWDSSQKSPDGFKAHEGPAMFKRNGLYYVIHGPACPYCNHTYAEYSSAKSPFGPWTFGTNGANGMLNETACGGQPTHVAILPNGKDTAFMFMSDLWNQTGFYDWKTDPRFHSNQAAANYFWTPLTFETTGAVKPFSCDAVSPITISGKVTPNSQSAAQLPAGASFVNWCDIGGSQRLQTFVPNTSGKLSAVSFNTFLGGNPGNSFPDGNLTVDIVDVNSSGQPMNILTTLFVDRATLGYSSRKVTIRPNVSVQAGKEYGLLFRASLAQGCYGFAYSDANPYPQGRQLYRSNSANFTVEPNRGLKFEVTVDGTTPPPVNKTDILMNLGGANYTDGSGNVWQAKGCPSGSDVFSTTAPIAGTLDSKLYQKECYSTGSLPYSLEVPGLTKGNNYNVILKFAEISYETTGQRVFNLDINGSRVLNNFDVYATAGVGYKAVDKSFIATADSTGKISITFIPISGKSSATVSAIRITSQ